MNVLHADASTPEALHVGEDVSDAVSVHLAVAVQDGVAVNVTAKREAIPRRTHTSCASMLPSTRGGAGLKWAKRAAPVPLVVEELLEL